MSESSQFDVLLLHNFRDKPAVRQIANALRHRGLRPWLDEDELLPGQSWQDSLEEVLRDVKALAVLIGKDGVGPWQQLELEAVLRDAVRRQVPVIPVLLPDAEEMPRLPAFLAALVWVDLRHGLSQAALSQLQWGITGERPAIKVVEPSKERFDLFLCFRGGDRVAVQNIARELSRRHIRCWPDKWDLSPAESWQELLSRNVQRIVALAVFAGDDGGPWIDDQVESFIWDLIESDRLVVPVILPNAKLDPKFPIYLRRRRIVDLRKSGPDPVSLLASLLPAAHGEKGSLDG